MQAAAPSDARRRYLAIGGLPADRQSAGWIAPEKPAATSTAVDGRGLPERTLIFLLGDGFIITAMLWVTAVVVLIDGGLLSASAVLVAAAGLHGHHCSA